MYDEVYEAWRKEQESTELQPLPKDFYQRLAEYVKRIREESRMLDENTAKAKLMKRELRNVHKVIEALLRLRSERIFKAATSGQTVASEILTEEEEKLHRRMIPVAEACQVFLKNILLGRVSRDEYEIEAPKRVLVRFLKDMPAIIGADMKPYGPFKAEDIGTVPTENAKALVKQGIATEVDYR